MVWLDKDLPWRGTLVVGSSGPCYRLWVESRHTLSQEPTFDICQRQCTICAIERTLKAD